MAEARFNAPGGLTVGKTPINSISSTNGATVATLSVSGASTLAAVSGSSLAITGASTFSTIPTQPTNAVDNNSTQSATTAYVLGQLSSSTPLVNGNAAPGSSLRISRQDHVHPIDTSRAPVITPVFTTSIGITGGTVTSSTPIINATQTWNNGSISFSGIKFEVTNTGSAAGSLVLDLRIGSNIYGVDTNGSIYQRLATPNIARDVRGVAGSRAVREYQDLTDDGVQGLLGSPGVSTHSFEWGFTWNGKWDVGSSTYIKDRSNAGDHAFMFRVSKKFNQEWWFSNGATPGSAIAWVNRVTFDFPNSTYDFSGIVSATGTPTTGNHLTNKTFTDATYTPIAHATDAALHLTSGQNSWIDAITASATEVNYLVNVSSSIQTQLNGKQATVTGAATTITSDNLTANRALSSNASGKVAVATTTLDELNFVSGVSSSIQTQLNGKQATVTGAATTITSSDLTVSRALASNGSGKVAVATTTLAELNFVNGVTSSIQTQLNGKQATVTGAATTITSSDLTAGKVLISNGSGKVAILNGTGHQMLGMNAAGSTPEFKTMIAGTGISIDTGTPGQFTLSASGAMGATDIVGTFQVRRISDNAVVATISEATGSLTTAATTGALQVGGTAQFNGNVTLGGNKVTMAVSTGNTVIAGTLNVAGTSTLAATSCTTISASGTSTLAGISGTSLSVSGGSTLAGLGCTTFNASGVSSFSSTLNVVGNFSVNTNKFNVTAASGNTTVAGTLGVTGLTSVVNAAVSGDMTLRTDHVLTTASVTTTTVSRTTIATLAGSTYRSADFIIQAVDATNGKYHTAKILAIHNGTTVNYTEYGKIVVGNVCGEFVVEYTGGNILLRVDPATTSQTVFKVYITSTKI